MKWWEVATMLIVVALLGMVWLAMRPVEWAHRGWRAWNQVRKRI